MQVEQVDGAGFVRRLLVVLVLGLGLVYGRSFGVGFYLEDAKGIAENPAIRSLSNIPSFFLDPFTLSADRAQVDVRPVVVTSYALNYAVSGLEPWSYHAFNLLVHLLSALLVFFIVRDHMWWPRTLRGPEGIGRWPAAAAALFFAFAPLSTQAVNSMWARSELLGTAFYLAAFLSLLYGRLLLAVCLQALALWTTSIALSVPLVFVAYDYIYRDLNRHPDARAWIGDWRELLVPLTPMVVVDALFLFQRFLVLPPWVAGSPLEHLATPWAWMLTQFSVLLEYATLFVWPSGLSVAHDRALLTSMAEPGVLVALVVVGVWITAAARNSWLFPQVAFATSWYFLTLAPQSSFWPQAEVMADHRPYLASTLGLSVLLVWVVDRLARLARARRGEAFVGLVALLCVASVVVGHQRTGEWSSEDRLWQSTAHADPHNPSAWLRAGQAHQRSGNLVEARRHYDRARTLRRGDPYVYVSLSSLELVSGNRDAAIVWGEEAVKYGEDLSVAHAALGEALRLRGRLREAVVEVARAVELNPKDEALRAALARVEAAAEVAESGRTDDERMKEGLRLLDANKPARAVTEFRAILVRTPDDEEAIWQLARALDASGEREQAREVWQQLLVLTEKNGDAIGSVRVRDRLSQQP